MVLLIDALHLQEYTYIHAFHENIVVADNRIYVHCKRERDVQNLPPP